MKIIRKLNCEPSLSKTNNKIKYIYINAEWRVRPCLFDN